MKFKQGDKSQAICEKCGLHSTTFDYRDVPVSDSQVVVPHLLVAVCDKCHQVVSIPQQSTSQIQQALKDSKYEA